MKKGTLSIGSNNTTKIVEIEKIKKIVGDTFEGFSIYELMGYWNNEEEKSVRIEIITENGNELKIVRLCKELKKKLNQDAIMLEIVDTTAVFI